MMHPILELLNYNDQLGVKIKELSYYDSYSLQINEHDIRILAKPGLVLDNGQVISNRMDEDHYPNEFVEHLIGDTIKYCLECKLLPKTVSLSKLLSKLNYNCHIFDNQRCYLRAALYLSGKHLDSDVVLFNVKTNLHTVNRIFPIADTLSLNNQCKLTVSDDAIAHLKMKLNWEFIHSQMESHARKYNCVILTADQFDEWIQIQPLSWMTHRMVCLTKGTLGPDTHYHCTKVGEFLMNKNYDPRMGRPTQFIIVP